jgi:hypothetical protein
MLATVWFYIAVFVAAVLLLAGVLRLLYGLGRWIARKRA